jgi:predicted lipoprotein with Yx(FWY)xxD motif
MFARPTLETPRTVIVLVLGVALAAAGCAAGTGAAAPTSGPYPTSALAAGGSAAPTMAPYPTAALVSPAPKQATPAPTKSSGGGRYGNPPASTPAPATGGIVVTAVMTAGGAVLAGPSGLTLYTHAGDSATASTCTGACASAWPPLTIKGGASATGGAGVTGAFGTLTRADGTIQVTYKGHPLYYWQGDSKPGDTTGNGVASFSVARP